MKLYRAPAAPLVGTFYEKQADVPKGLKFETVEFPFAASPKADFVSWLNERGVTNPVTLPDENEPVSPQEWASVTQPLPQQPTSAHADQIMAFEDQFEAMPLPTQLHFAALAMENARERIGIEGAPARAPQRYGDDK